MNPAPEFVLYPEAQAPKYSRWWITGAVLLALLSNGVMQTLGSGGRPQGEANGPFLMTAVVAGVSVLWLLAFLLRILFYRFNQHNAHCYAETAQQVQHAWWARHRQTVALVEAVLVGSGCGAPDHRQTLFDSNHKPPEKQDTKDGPTLRLLQVFGPDIAERERQLAVLLAMQWQEQRTEPAVLQPVHCYWQGSLAAWQAFVEQMATSLPLVQLPESPEPWQGMRSLDLIIDQLQGAPANTRVLCAGCHSSTPQQDSRLPAGEAAVLWLLGPQGGVRVSRGEWFSAESEDLAAVAERAVQQSQLEAPASTCVSFSQPQVPHLSDIGWNTKQNVQDIHFGALGNLEAMVVQTLAAWYAEQHGVPCAWLASDPYHTLALGIVEPDDSNN